MGQLVTQTHAHTNTHTHTHTHTAPRHTLTAALLKQAHKHTALSGPNSGILTSFVSSSVSTLPHQAKSNSAVQGGHMGLNKFHLNELRSKNMVNMSKSVSDGQ